MLLECSSRLETPKILVITPDFASKKRFFVDFAVKNSVFFLVFTPKFEGKNHFFADYAGKTFFIVIWSSSQNQWSEDLCFFDLHMTIAHVS